MNGFVHLHLHTEYSLLDGAARIKDIPEAVRRAGQTAAAITDHGNMFGVVEFFSACKKEGIKAVIGCEVYVAINSMTVKIHTEEAERGHLVLLAENETGYKNLIYLVSMGYTEGFYSKPRIDLDILSRHSEGLIALSACLGGFVQRYLARNDFEEAKNYALKLKNIFGRDNFFLELQEHNLQEQRLVNMRLLSLANSLDLDYVITNDVHYIDKEDADTQAALMCIQMNKMFNDGRPIGFETDEFYLKTENEMRSVFDYLDDEVFNRASKNTVKIAERCNVDFDFSKLYLPEYIPPNGKTAPEYLRELSFAGLERYAQKEKVKNTPIDEELYRERLDFELSVINSMGYADYYLLVYDIVNFAKSKSIPVGPGRGSGAGSLVAFCISIVEVDSIKYNLYFERFLNPERVSMPDFDIDICQERRGEVIEYIIQRFGEKNTAHIITFGTMAARGVIRDVGRVLGYDYREIDMVAKSIPHTLNMTIDKALELSSKFSEFYHSGEKMKKLIDMAKRLEGIPRHTSTHAAGMVILNKPVYEFVPIAVSSGMTVTQFTMNTIADLGLLKMDFLGLRYLTIIENTVKQIKEKDKNFTISDIPLDDEEVFKLFASGQTDGIFQFESGWVKNFLLSMKPERLEDIFAATALIRPGPMESIPAYVRNRNNKKAILYAHPMLEDILEETYGCIIYQEQVMEIFRKLGGYSYGRADIIRRAMSKKKEDEMESERDDFLAGCVSNGVDEEVAVRVYDEMAEFSKYAFNKSHAAAYGIISYSTAYLKKYYFKEYMSALLNSTLHDTDKISGYIAECEKFRVKILPPDINESGIGFTANENGIRFGLLAIKNVGENFIKDIIKERGGGPFSSFYDFIKRMNKYDINKRQVEGLIKCGIFDNFGVYRSRLLYAYEGIMDNLNIIRRTNLDGQLDLFSMTDDPEFKSDDQIKFPDIEEFDFMEMLRLEKESSGRFFSGHPLNEYGSHIKKLGAFDIEKINEAFSNDETEYIPRGGEPDEIILKDGDTITVAGIINNITAKRTKNNDMMAFVSLEDENASIEVIVFPKKYADYAEQLKINAVIAAKGTISVREDEAPKILLNYLYILNKDSPKEKTLPSSELTESEISVKNPGKSEILRGEKQILYLKTDDIKSETFKKAENLLKIFDGETKVRVFEESTGKIYNLTALSAETNDVLIMELKRQLGEDNVKLVKENKKS